MSDISIVPEKTLTDTTSEAREWERQPAVLVRARQEPPVAILVEDEVHNIGEEVR